MAQATIVAVWKDAGRAFVAATVDDGAPRGVVEYQASTPLLDAAGAAKNNATLKADLTAALKVVRDAQIVGTQAVAGISGSVTV